MGGCVRRLDADAVVALFEDAFFFGSNPTLYRGRDGVTAYFEGIAALDLPTFRSATSDRRGGAISSTSRRTASFGSMGAPLTVKITWVIVREDGDWKIVSHHVSSKAPLI